MNPLARRALLCQSSTFPRQTPNQESRLHAQGRDRLGIQPRLIRWVLWGLMSCATATGAFTADSTSQTTRSTVKVQMRDGIGLATDLYIPSVPGNFPVVLARTPYNKSISASLGTNGAGRGYAVVIQDVRGRFESEGENLPFNLDVTDGFDTMEWVSRQPWCNGKIGTVGGSAGAITQLQLAIVGHSKLACQHLVVGAPNLYQDCLYTGGVFRKSLIEDWLRGSKFSDQALPRWVEHPLYDDYWRERDISRNYGSVNCPAVHIGGYWDIFAQGTIDSFLGYQKSGGPAARGSQKLIMGPWTHGVLQERAGELTFRNAKRPPGNVHDSWRWFDRWLKGADNGIDRSPPVTYYVIGDTSDTSAPGNTWRTSETWPPVKATPTAFYLAHDKSLTTTRPSTSASFHYAFDPANPAPTIGGIQLSIPAGPMDQRKLDSRSDVLVFSTPALDAPLEVTGQISASLWISSTAKDTDFFATLCDVYPDGRAFNLCEGRIRTRFRESFSAEQFLEQNKVTPIQLDLWATSVIFNKGHRIRVQITSSSAPGFDPNPNTGAPFRSSTHTAVATNTIHIGGATPSRIMLPVAQ